MINFESSNKWQMRTVTATLFILGFVAGIFALSAYNLWFGAGKPPTKHERYQEAFDQLNLNETQKGEVQRSVAAIREEIQQLQNESEPRMQGIRDRNDSRLRKILTPEQWAKFQEMREEIRRTEK